MPNGVDEGVISYAIYEDEKMFYGVAEVDLPDFENMVFNVSGAGVLGEIEIPVMAQLKAMTTTFKFNHANEAAYALAEERVHTLSLWRADQHYNYSGGELETKQKKIIMRVVPKKLTGGTVKNASPIAVNGEYAVHYYAEIDANGKKLCEFDPLNFRYIDHTGKERAAEIRKCLGMS